MDKLIHDLVYSLRVLRKTPGFTLVALLCIALGIGANAAIFSVISNVLLAPLPFPGSDRLVAVYDTYQSEGEWSNTQVSRLNFLKWRDRARAFQGIGAAEIAYFNFTGEGEPVRVKGSLVSAGLLPVLGVKPLLGRTFLPEEEGRSGAGAPVVVVGHDFWRSQLGGDSAVLGKPLMLDGQARTVIGVMPAGFRFPEGADNPGGAALWVPMDLDPGDTSPAAKWHTLIVAARLAPGVEVAQARDAMQTMARQLAQEYPDTNDGWGAEVEPLHEDMVGNLRPVLSTLMAAVGFVLLIGCVNVATLQIARTLTRRGEVAVRMALGCGRRRLFRQLVTENVVLALLGGALGLVLAYAAIPLLLPLNPTRLSLFDSVGIDWGVLAFAIACSVVVGVLLGLASGLRLVRAELSPTLREGGGRLAGRGSGRRLQSALIVAQVALALILLVGAGVLLKSMLLLQEVDPGFDAANLLTLGMILPEAKYPEEHDRVAFVDRMLAEVGAVPGVKAAGTTLSLPIGGSMQARFAVEGKPDDKETLITNHRLVSPDFLKAMGIPLLAGRHFTAADDADAPGVAIVSRELARRYWPGEDALGKRVRRGSPDDPWLTVVGVVEDVKDAGLDAELSPTWYLPLAQHDFSALRLVVRTAPDPYAMVAPVRAAIGRIDKDQAVYDVAPMTEVIAGTLVRRRFSALLVSLFAGLGLVMMTVGLYGVISHLVNQRRSEIGIRMALGAQTGSVLSLVLREGLALTLADLAIGRAGTSLLTRFLSGMVYGMTPTDPRTLLEMSLILGATALLATLVPARRATRVDPLTVLRS
jgi:putative ABC transport system permease protein